MSMESPIQAPATDSLECGAVDPSRKWYQAKLFSFGITPTGYIAVGIAPMGVVAIGVVPMGVISIGTVAMGVISAGFVSMGIAAFGDVSMSKLGGHKGGKAHHPVPAQQVPVMEGTEMEKSMPEKDHSQH
ncbi:MAG: hypothetical protein RLZZ490_1046 [Cyanobacteriota bacterium]